MPGFLLTTLGERLLPKSQRVSFVCPKPPNQQQTTEASAVSTFKTLGGCSPGYTRSIHKSDLQQLVYHRDNRLILENSKGYSDCWNNGNCSGNDIRTSPDIELPYPVDDTYGPWFAIYLNFPSSQPCIPSNNPAEDDGGPRTDQSAGAVIRRNSHFSTPSLCSRG